MTTVATDWSRDVPLSAADAWICLGVCCSRPRSSLFVSRHAGKALGALMDETLTRFFTNLFGRVEGPMSFRFIFQPAIAALCALSDGMKDAREGRPAYVWTIFTRPDERESLMREGSKKLTRVIGLGVAMDAVYQVIVVRWIYPGELITIVLLLAVAPYLLVRGPVNRIARRLMTRKVHVG